MAGWPRTTVRSLTLLAMALAVAASVFCLAAPAFAGVITTWSLQPANGSTVGTNIPVIVRGTTPWNANGLQVSTVKLYVDGMLVPRSSYTATASRTSLYMYWAPSPALPDGVRTFRAEISDAAGLLSFRQWSATIAQAPSAAWVAPLAGSVHTNGSPLVKLLLADNTPGTTFTVVGEVHQGSATGPVVATFGADGLAAGQSSFACSTELAPGTYYLTATIADAAGNVRTLNGAYARMFETEAAAPMSGLDSCDACHASIAQAHPTPATADCTLCHVGYGDEHMQGTEYCEDCHWDGWHTDNAKTSVVVTSPCTSCHAAARAEVVQHTPVSVEPSHVGSCGSCHVESLVARHAVTPAGSSYAYQCDLCHSSSDPAVVAAIAAGDTTCSACHGGPESGHEAVHTIERTDGCATCHEGASLTTVHMVNASLTCATCHESEDPEVVAAIAASALACDGCHVTAGVDYHPNMGAAHISPVSTYETCSGCHHSWGSNPLRGHDITRHAGGCVTCHNAEIDLTDKTALCSSCHINEGAGTPPEAYHLQTEALHTATSSASLDCARCHNADLRLVHTETTSCDTCHTGLCSECHTPHNPMGASLGVGAECARCHTTQGTDYHSTFATKHTNGTMSSSCQAAGCHAATLVEAHAAYVGPAGRYPQYTDTCALCHLNEDPLRVPAGATAACGSCHATADHSLQHDVTLAAECAGCHTDNNLLPYHEALGCAACHESTAPAVIDAIAGSDKRCEACHGAAPHGDLTATHAATVTSGPVNVFDYHEGYSPLTWDVECGLCHASTNLLGAHASECGACHSGTKPAESFATWNKTCSQGACHPGLSHAGDYAHDGYDCEAACHEYDWSVYYSSCDACHNPSSSAPSTTSNAQANYVGAATIQFSSSNFAFTFYRLDGGPKVGSSTLVVPPPASGSQAHTVEFWSVSDGGHEELPHKSASFTIAADTQPPTTTSNALTSYIGPTTITLGVTDNGSSPVQGTYWRLNGGAVQSGRTVSVPQPPSGQQSYDLEFWSVDASGNEELPHKWANFTVTADTTAPTGSIVIGGGAAYTITYYPILTLSASDAGGSGVSQMRFSNDNVNWGSWETYSTTRSYWYLSAGWGTKTVYVQFRDRAGNVATYSDTIIWDAGGPAGSIAINAGAASTTSSNVTINMSITDTPAGVESMRFSNENTSSYTAWEPFSATKAWTLAAGSGTRRVYAQFRDNAGNISTTSDTITVAGDITAPTGSVVINGGAASTATTSVTLTLSATDNVGGSGMSQMQFSNDNVSWSTWETYATSKSWTLTSGDGAKTVYVKYRDVAGNISSAYSDGITLATVDGTAPTGSISINSGAASTSNPAVTLSLSASDTGGSGMSQMQFSNDNVSWTTWETYATSKAWTLPGANGLKTVYVRYRDGAGNVSPVYQDTITLDVPVGTATLAFIWHPDDWAEAELRVVDSVGNEISSTWVSGYGTDLDWYVDVPSGGRYYMECIYYYDDWNGSEGGPYGYWTDNVLINADGVLSPGETVIWYY